MRQSSDEFDLPEALQQKLNGLLQIPSVSREIDEHILNEARQGFALRNRFRLRIRKWTAAGCAAAAAIVLATGVYFGTQSKAPALAGDLDRNGRIDIVDALLLARQIETKSSPSLINDINHDGVITQADVEQLALAAVKLPHLEALQ